MRKQEIIKLLKGHRERALEILEDYLSTTGSKRQVNFYEGYADGFMKSAMEVNELLDEEKLPVIPEYVANTIVYLQRRELEEGIIPKVVSADELGKKLEVKDFRDTQEWVSKNFRKYAYAYAVGYTIEEKKYFVISKEKRMMLVRMMDDKTITEADPFTFDSLYRSEWHAYALTEKEIKDFDERYWAFKEEIIE